MSKIVGTPYEDKDCWDIVRDFYREVLNIDLSRFNEKPDSSKVNADNFNCHIQNFIRIEEPFLGAILLFRILGHNSHIGVYLGEGKFLHTEKKTGCVIARVSDWENRIQGYYQWPYSD